LEHFSISQVSSKPPALWAYADITGSGDSSIDTLPVQSLQAEMDGRNLPVAWLRRFHDTGEGVAYILLVDVSQSVSKVRFADVQKALLAFTGHLNSKDRAAVIAFGDKVQIVSPYSADKQALKRAIDGLKANASMTHLNAGLLEAAKLAHRLDAGLPQRRSIIVLSDGKDEGSGLTTDDVLKVFENDRTPVYAVGASSLPKPERATYLEVLHRYAQLSGGAYYDLSGTSVDKAYSQIQDRIARVWEANFDCSACPADDQRHTLLLRVILAGQIQTDSALVTLAGWNRPIPTQMPWWKTLGWWSYPLAAVVILAILAALLQMLRLKRQLATPPDVSVTGMADESPVSLTNYPTTTLTPQPAIDDRPGPKVEFIRRENRGGEPAYSAKLVEHLTIGRSQAAQLRIPDSEISSKHCQLELHNGLILISDLGSTHGTSVNGIPVTTRYKIESGDLVSLGRVEFRVRIYN
jgi:VWFA-related protein